LGRKKKVLARLLDGPHGRPVRVAQRLEKPYYPLKSKPHGKAANVWELTTILKERAPLVYLFVVDQIKKPIRNRDPKLQGIIEELKQITGRSRSPSSRERLAYVIERAMEDAWATWGLTHPFSIGDHDAFFRRYVHGHPGAIKVFRQALHQPKPWHRHHVGHEIQWFLGNRGEAARHYQCLIPAPRQIPVMTIIEE